MDVVVSVLAKSQSGATRLLPKWVAALGAVGLVTAALVLPMGPASAGSDLTICHATGSDNNPYISNHPDRTADVGGHDGHDGPVWSPTLANGVAWGDIIPPFTIDGSGLPYAGKNWTVDGQEIYNNSCNAVNPDLKLVKTSSGNALAGSTGSYTITVSNIGNGTAHGPFTVSDTMPSGVIASGAAGAGWICAVAGGGGSISCVHAANLAPHTVAAAIVVSVTWSTIGTKVNTASVTVLPDDPSANNTGRTTTVISAVVVHTLGLTVNKTSDANSDGTYSDGETAPANGGSVTYRVKVDNTSDYPVTVDAISDVVGSAAAAAVTCDSALIPVGSGQASLGATLAAHSTAYCYFQLAGPANGGSSTDQVTVDVHETSDATNQTSDSDDTTVRRAAAVPQLVMHKTGPSSATVGDSGNYRLTVQNTGDATGAALTVTDSLPTGVVLNGSPTGTGWLCTTALVAPQVSCTQTGTLGLAAGATSNAITVPVTFQSGAIGKATDSASVATVTGETDTSDNTATFDTTVRAASMVVKTNDANNDSTFSTDETAPAPGQNVTFRLRVTNNNPYAVTVGSVYDFVGADSEGVSVGCVTPFTEGSPLQLAAGATGDCFFTMTGYSPADGQSKTDSVTVVLTEVSPQLRRAASARRAASLRPPSLTSNRSTVTTHVPVVPPPPLATAPDLSIVKTGPATAVTPGNTLQYALVVTNTGTAAASGVQVTDTLPAGLTLISVGGTGFTCTLTPIVCTLAGSLAPGATATVNLAANLSSTYAASSVANVGVVSPTDGTPADNTSTARTDVTLPGPPAVQDLGLSKTGTGAAKPGDELVYTVVVTNVKGTPATGFTVTDVLPAGLSFSSASGTDFVCSNVANAITCVYAGSLGVGQTAQVVVRALLLETFTGTDVANTAIVDPGRSDDNAANNSSTATTTVTQPTAAPIAGGAGGGATGGGTPSTGGGGGAASGAGGALPFTGTYADRLLEGGVSLLVLGLFVALLARRRERDAS
jgi:uncharacterized repeat protein (TIGR01451 family)